MADENSKAANIEVRILRLRKKLSDAGFPMTAISVVRGWGYKLSIEIEVI
jgi:DNA-binding response OmpR family regulator